MTTNTNAALREKLIDLIAEHLSGTYHCNRVWEAWNVGTMSQDDFEDVGESDTPTELADVILAALSTAAQPPAGIWVPTELAERVQETMGEFLMDHGWRQQDMDTSDEFGALLAATPKAAPPPAVQQGDASPTMPRDIEMMATNRYRPVPSGVLAYKVVGGDGNRSLFSGTKDECQIVARKLTEAFLDGAYVALSTHPAAPAAQGDALDAKHIAALTEIVRMPNAEYVADAHNAAVKYLRARAAKEGGEA